jgi:hypothetical protein
MARRFGDPAWDREQFYMLWLMSHIDTLPKEYLIWGWGREMMKTPPVRVFPFYYYTPRMSTERNNSEIMVA